MRREETKTYGYYTISEAMASACEDSEICIIKESTGCEVLTLQGLCENEDADQDYAGYIDALHWERVTREELMDADVDIRCAIDAACDMHERNVTRGGRPYPEAYADEWMQADLDAWTTIYVPIV